MTMFKRLLGRTSRYEATQLDEGDTTWPADVQGTLLRVRPSDSQSAIADAVPMFRALHEVDTTLTGRNACDHHAFEGWFHEGTIEWYGYATTATAADTFRRRIATAYPDSEIAAVEEKPAFPAVEPDDYVAGAWLSTRQVPAYPIRQHDVEGFEADPYGDLTAELCSREDSSVVVQVLFRPAKRSWADGDRFKRNSVEDIAEAYTGETSVGVLDPRLRESTKRERRIAEIATDQRSDPAFHVTVRVAAISSVQAEATERVRGVGRVFETAYDGLSGQGFATTPVWSRWRGRHETALRRHLARMAERAWVDRGSVLTVDELAGVAHLPPCDVETGTIDRVSGTEGENTPADAGWFRAADRYDEGDGNGI